jgi:hypothetical protein
MAQAIAAGTFVERDLTAQDVARVKAFLARSR